MVTQDGYEIDLGDQVWAVQEPLAAMFVDLIFFNDEQQTVDIWVRKEGQEDCWPRNYDELYGNQRQCLFAARSVEYNKIKMYQEFIDVTRKKIDMINEAIDNG